MPNIVGIGGSSIFSQKKKKKKKEGKGNGKGEEKNGQAVKGNKTIIFCEICKTMTMNEAIRRGTGVGGRLIGDKVKAHQNRFSFIHRRTGGVIVSLNKSIEL